MEHLLAKTIIITKVTELIASEYKISLREARDKLYESDVVELIEDDETGLYGDSPLYVFSIFERHNQNKKQSKHKEY